ncbi:SurA N-terminal domain-containing protein [Oleiagrimonas soli]|uniref:Periplasmic chaperone PpiD n=1 Tax=Oleiagrimonas soli TaxID=1543381 RepID=A0A099CV99_9GAMM|nr:SurA N-terminal domain-containing protein [Oleiagrimonas soli]KGI77596.1 peptidylprolyl isomerase [Oleiagrimonas soli]MBB6182913.1 peptidyl-prolyl cis-trans isomerase D [Oleiagrimonas soli]
MLQNLREKLHGWPAIILFGALALLLASFGLIGYVSQNVDTFVAKVGKHEISQTDYQDRMNALRRQATETQGANFDPSYFDKPEVKEQVLDALIKQQLLQQANDHLGLKVTDAELRDEIANDSNFQVDGKFNADTYSAVLTANGMTPQMYQNRVRASLETELLPNAISSSEVITDDQVDEYLRLQTQKRDLRYVMLPRPALTDTTVSDKEVADWYAQHKADFMTPEKVSVNYIELSTDDVKADSTPDEAALKQRYEREKNRYQEPEQRLVSHILIDVPKNATPAQQKTALAKAESVYKKAESGADFAKLAKQYSDDLGSKNDGGNLGWIERGVTNKAFEDALFSMKQGQISKPVLSPEGYHIIDLRGVRAGKVKPFSEVRDQLAKEMEQGDLERKYSELAGKLTDKVYADPSALAPIAQELGLKVQHTDLFTRDGAKQGIASNPKVVKAAFSDQVLVQGNTSDAIDLGSNRMVVVHMLKHEASKLQPLDQVSGQIRANILAQRVAKAAKAQADKLLAEVRKNGDLDKDTAGLGVAAQSLKGAQRVQNGVSPKLLETAFSMPHPAKGKATYATVEVSDGNYALIALDGVQPGDISKIPEMVRNGLRQRMAQAYATTETNAFIDVLQKHTKIEIAKQRM